MEYDYTNHYPGTRIVIIEDNDMIRHGYALIVSSHPNFKVINDYSDCETAIKNLNKDRPDIILMDIGLPGMDGITGIGKIKKLDPKVEIIILSIFEDYEKVFKALCAGAVGYLSKTSNHTEILDGINQVLKGGAPMSLKIAKMVVGSFQRNTIDSPLSRRETEVLSLLATGATYQVVSKELIVGIETVKTHVKNIYAKLNVNSKTEALSIAKENKIISLM
jgi:DNA-binding NarL/FixJ family response regulator